MSEVHKLRIKIGDAEFEAEGSEESVRQQYEAFLGALADSSSKKREELAENDQPDLSEEGKDDQELIDRAFIQGKSGLVSLRFLPRTEQRDADTLLLLLYGYHVLKGEEAVLGTQLIRAGRQSGLNLDRIDRAISKHDSLLLKGGARKGMKYTLNNQGRIKAREILKQMLV